MKVLHKCVFELDTLSRPPSSIACPRHELTKRARRERLVRTADGLLTEAVHLGFSAEEVSALVAERLTRFQWERGEGESS